ncbi:MAG TPA: alpha/beta fold hydrolase [Gemmatimonadaceae bacterium]|nr:alpha/beta fold hydrolase [Gemmatimonadaceae bacterium]
MRRQIFLLLAAAVNTAAAQGGGITHVDTIVAPSLAGNLIGDTNRREVTVYLPPSYSKNRAKRYPVVYLLHGFAADHRAFMAGVYTNMNTRLSMDSLIREGLVREMIVVTPNARNAFDGSFYRNSVTTGNWEDFVYRDLVSFIDKRYRTIRNRSGRGIAGHSMGGYGALWVGMRHPETFSAIYALSPCCLRDFGAVSQRGVGPWKAALRVTEKPQILKAGFTADLLLALAAVYSPNASKPPLFIDLPNRIEGDSIVEVPDIAAKWLASPMTFISQYAPNLRRTAIAFDAGRQDALKDIPISVTMLDSALTELGVPHTAELYDGDHMRRIRSRIESHAMPFFSRVLR